MVFGTNPQRMNQRTGPLGLPTYTGVPDTWAIMQSGNLYVYCINNPVKFVDPSGEFIKIAAAAPRVVAAVRTAAGAASAAARTVAPAAPAAAPAVQRAATTVKQAAPAVQRTVQQVAPVVQSPAVQQVVRKTSQNPAAALRAAEATLNVGSMRESLLRTVQNPKLRNAVNELYRSGASIGDGGTAAALRHEFSSGQALRHLPKAQERIRNLENIIRQQNLSSSEDAIARKLLRDLHSAVNFVSP